MTARFCDLPDGPAPPHVLSVSTARRVLQSPRHAWLAKRGLLRDRDESERADDCREIGSALHSLILKRGRQPVPIPFDSYRSAAAREMAVSWRALGCLPLLAPVAETVAAIANRAITEMAEHGIVLSGVSEQGVEWIEEAGDVARGATVECVGRLDHWREDVATIYDVKTGRSAHPAACRRELARCGGDIQSAAYTSAIERIHPELAGRVEFVFIFVETSTGIVTPVRLSGEFRALGERRWRRAVHRWARCLRTNEWPGYVTGVATVDAPAWVLAEDAEEAFEAEEEADHEHV